MNDLFELTEKIITDIPGLALYSIKESAYTDYSLHRQLANKVIASDGFEEWMDLIPDPGNDELNIQLEFTLKRIITTYIENNTHWYEDVIESYLESEEYQSDPHGYYGVSEENIVGV